jgi:hypothetical protein
VTFQKDERADVAVIRLRAAMTHHSVIDLALPEADVQNVMD